MNDEITKIDFNIWANSVEEGAEVKQTICDFIAWHGERGIKITAEKILAAFRKWERMPIAQKMIMNHFR